MQRRKVENERTSEGQEEKLQSNKYHQNKLYATAAVEKLSGRGRLYSQRRFEEAMLILVPT